MKIVIATAGLGNMMFQYAIVSILRKMGVRSILFVSNANAHHNGYELEYVFPSVKPYEGLPTIGKWYYQLLGKLRQIRFSKNKNFPHQLLLFPFKRFHARSSFTYYSEVYGTPNQNTYLLGYFQCYEYYKAFTLELQKLYAFNESRLSAKSSAMARTIRKTEDSVFVHVRRGDYVTDYYYKMFGSICNLDYYRRAVSEIKSRLQNPHFFIFSDDPEYVRENMSIAEATYVDFNYGKEAWQDMCLMSMCKHGIIANSTFSWWAAFLNRNEDKIVIAPSKWWGDTSSIDVLPPSWSRI